ncbi:AzlD domain-containing protein [Anaerolentibacter hominis]|uniref:AzlD domain-containing protein n=1 Tax=Anaerolentibacter hominis TaxID=3079009 RepID=UPI0031B875D7
MDMKTFLLYVLVMGGVTYLLRMVPFVAVRRKLNNQFVRSFLFYVPYAVLGAMTIPDIFYSTASIWSALAGLAMAVILSLKEKDLLTVALSACAAVFVSEQVLHVLRII